MESYGELICKRLKDKKVEIFLGTNSKSHEYLDYSVSRKEVVRGIVRDAEGDLLIIEISKHGQTNLVYLNIWNIYMVVEPKNSISIVDVYCDADSKQVK
jgi:hypothetical protein